VPQLRKHVRLQLSRAASNVGAPVTLTAIALTLVCLLVVGCGGAAATPGSSSPEPAIAPSPADPGDDILERLDAIDAAVSSWRSATDLAAVRAAAEATRNLVVGPDGPGYGDADGDGSIGGVSTIGLLPGSTGEPGLAGPTDGPCVVADVLGGSWAVPASRWATLQAAIDAWSPSDNTFPSLPSHPQRIVGWATLALAGDDLEDAVGYAGHAALHSAIARQAVTACGS
jgi:hypothetical protein